MKPAVCAHDAAPTANRLWQTAAGGEGREEGGREETLTRSNTLKSNKEDLDISVVRRGIRGGCKREEKLA